MKPDILLHADGLDPTIFPMPEPPVSLSLDKFLNVVMIEISDKKFTIRDIIKYTANKAGGVHFDDRLDEQETAIQATLEQLNIIGISALAIAIRSISMVVLRGLAPLRKAIVKVPDSIPLIAHYKVDRGGSIFFAGKQWLESDNLGVHLDEGFSWAGVLRIINQPASGDRIIYEVGRKAELNPKITIFVDKYGSLCCSARLNSTTTLETHVPDFTKSMLFDRYFYLLCELCLRENIASLTMYVNNVETGNTQQYFRSMNRVLDRHVIGGSLAGRRSAAFYVEEILLASRCLSAEERKGLAKYLWLEWKD